MNGLVPGASFTDFVRGELESLVFRTMTRVRQGLIIHRYNTLSKGLYTKF